MVFLYLLSALTSHSLPLVWVVEKTLYGTAQSLHVSERDEQSIFPIMTCRPSSGLLTSPPALLASAAPETLTCHSNR